LMRKRGAARNDGRRVVTALQGSRSATDPGDPEPMHERRRLGRGVLCHKYRAPGRAPTALGRPKKSKPEGSGAAEVD